MKFVQCKNCRHLNPIKSEYQIFCDACGKKNANNFKAWQQSNPNKNFEDFKNIVGVEFILPKEEKKKISFKQLSQKSSLILFFLTVLLIGYKYNTKLSLFFQELAPPIPELLEKQWKRHYYHKNKISFESPYFLEKIDMKNQLSEDIENLIQKMEHYAYTDHPSFNLSFTKIVHKEAVGIINLTGSSNTSMNHVVKTMNGTDFYATNTDTFVNQYPSIVKKGSFISDGNTIKFKSITCLKNDLTLLQLTTLWLGDNNNYVLLSDRIINSLDVR